MSSPVITPDASAAPASSPAPASPAPDAGQPSAQPSGTPAGSPPAVAADAQPVAPSNDQLDLLKDDLAVSAADPAQQPTDLATKYKDDPAVQALVAEKAAFTPMAEILAASQIAKPEELKGTIDDAYALYSVVAGQKPASALLETMLANPAWTPEQKNAVIADLAKYISTKTGQPIAAAAAGQPITDPAMAAIEQMKAERKAEKDAANLQAFTQRVNTAKATISAKVGELLTGTFLEGDAAYVVNQFGSILGLDKAMAIIESAERGDFKEIEKALKAVKTAEAQRFKSYTDRLIAMKTKKANTIPAQVAGGSAPSAAPENPDVAPLETDARRKWMAERFKIQQ